MAQVFANNAYGSLGAGVIAGTTSLTLATGNGARFPSPTGGDFFLLTLVGIDGELNENLWEVVKCTGRSGDTLTVVRAQEGTAAQSWSSGTRVELRVTAGTLSPLGAASTVGLALLGAADAAAQRSALGLANHNALTVTNGGAVTGNGAFTSKGANLVNEASAVKLSQETASGSYLTAYGADAGTQGSLTVVLKSSNGSASSVPAVFSSTGVAIIGALSVTDAATTRSNLGLANHDLVAVDGIGRTTVGDIVRLKSIGDPATTGTTYTSLQSSGDVERAWYGFGEGDGTLSFQNNIGNIRIRSITGRHLYGGVGDNGVDDHQFSGSGRFTGNVGVGVTPSNWNSSYKALEVSGASIFASSALTGFTANAYLESSGANYLYKVTDAATFYRQYQGAHTWFTAPSGTAGSAINFTQNMTLDSTGLQVAGNLSVGGASEGAKLKVALTGANTDNITTVSDFGTGGVVSLGGVADNGSGVYLGTGDARVGGSSGIAAGIGFLREAIGWRSAIAFYTNGTTDGATTNRITERLRINSSGRILANTTDDGSSLLQVGGNARVGESLFISTAANAVGSFRTIGFRSGEYEKAQIRSYSLSTADAGDLRFYTAPDGDLVAERLRINQHGRIIANTTDDGTSLLQVGGNVRVVGDVVATAAVFKKTATSNAVGGGVAIQFNDETNNNFARIEQGVDGKARIFTNINATGWIPRITLGVETEFNGNVQSSGSIKATSFSPTYYDSGTTNALNFANGSIQRWAPNTGSQTLTITNWPASGTLGELLIRGVNLGAATITWPTINWVKSDGTTTTTFANNGVTLQASGTDWVFLWTSDAGTTIYGKIIR